MGADGGGKDSPSIARRVTSHSVRPRREKRGVKKRAFAIKGKEKGWKDSAETWKAAFLKNVRTPVINLRELRGGTATIDGREGGGRRNFKSQKKKKG